MNPSTLVQKSSRNQLNFLIFISVLLGILFCYSSIYNILNMRQFVQSFAVYGFPKYQSFSPILIAAEFGLGLILLFNIAGKKILLLSATTLFSFLLYVSINDTQQISNDSLFIIKIIIYIALLIILYLNKEHNPQTYNNIFKYAVITLSLLIFFVAGFPYARSISSPMISVVPGEKVERSILSNVISTTRDSTYLLFLFSPTCAHCKRMTPRISSIGKEHAVDRVIALCASDQREFVNDYTKEYKPNFSINIIDKNKFSEITKRVPVAILIKNNHIISMHANVLPPNQQIRSSAL